MTSWKVHLGAAAVVLLAGNFGSGVAQAAPAIGAASIADAAKTAGSTVDEVRYRGRRYGYRHGYGRRYGGYYGRRYGGSYGSYYGGRHWRHRHDNFPAALLLGGLLGAGLGYGGGYGYGYGPSFFGGDCF